MILIYLFVFALIGQTAGSKILFATMPQGRSHIWSMLPFGHRLLLDKHEVTVFFEIFQPEIPFGEGIKDHLILWKGVDPFVVQLFDESNPLWLEVCWNGDYTADILMLPWMAAVVSLQHILANQQQEFWSAANQSWDAFVVDPLFANSGMAMTLLKQPKVPYIHFCTAQLDPIHAYFNGLGRSLAVAPSTTLVARSDYTTFSVGNLADRLKAIYDSLHFTKMYLWNFEEMVRDSMSPVVRDFSFKSWIRGGSLTFYEYFDYFDWPLPVSRDLIHVGAHCPPPPLPMSDEIANFVNDPKSKGTILITFGTIVRWELAPKRVLDVMLTAMRELSEFRFLWSYAGEDLGWPKNVKASKWLPQIAILNHPKTVLVFSHGGLKSVKEALCAEVPMLFMPMFAEQVRNAMLAQKLGIAQVINKKTVTSAAVIGAVRGVTSRKEYKENVKRIKTIWLDRVLPSLEAAAFWTNKVIELNGLPEKYFKTKPRDRLIERLYLDFMGIFMMGWILFTLV